MRRNSKKLLMAVAVTLMVAIAMVSTASAANYEKSVYFIFTGYTYPYFAPMANAIKQADKQYPDLSITIVSAHNSASQQIAAMKQAIAAGADGIILNPVQQSVTFAAKQAMQNGIPVVTIDRDVSQSSARVVFIGSDDFTLGRKPTKYAIETLAENGVPTPWRIIVLQGTLGASVSIDRLQGAMSVLKPLVEQGKVEIILNQSANFSTTKAQKMISILLAKTTDIDLIVASNDAMALGAINALKAHNIEPGKETLVIGADAQPESLAAIEAGTQLATVTHSPFIEAYWAVEAMHNIFSHGVTPPADQFPKGNVLIPMTLVTKHNIDKISRWGTPKVIPPLPYGHSKPYKVEQSQ